jgi:hypothetical protein
MEASRRNASPSSHGILAEAGDDGLAVLCSDGRDVDPPAMVVGRRSVGRGSRRLSAGYGWIWDAPPSPAELDWQPVIWWWRLFDQWTIVGVGMVLLLFLRECRERGRGLDHGPENPSGATPEPASAVAVRAVQQ